MLSRAGDMRLLASTGAAGWSAGRARSPPGEDNTMHLSRKLCGLVVRRDRCCSSGITVKAKPSALHTCERAVGPHHGVSHQHVRLAFRLL